METIRAAYAAWAVDRSRVALVRLFEASQLLVFGVCYEILRHRQDAEDATQRVLLELQKGLADVRDPDHFLHRVRLVAFRTALDTKRDRRRRIDRERKAADMTSSAPISDEVREAIHEAMAALDDESRALVIEHYFEKSTLDEIGARRGVTGAAIWKRIEGIKGKLRHGLALAGLAAAASKAEACLEAATLATPTTNLVSGAVLAGGVMTTKATTVAAAVIVSMLTFTLGVGGGLAIQSARPARSSPDPVVSAQPKSSELTIVEPSPRNARVPIQTELSSALAKTDLPVDRMRIAREIWDQIKRPRFWKDMEAREETLPKLKLLGPEQAAFFVDKFRQADLALPQKTDAVRLALTCGGPEAAALLLELMQGAADSYQFRIMAQGVLKGDGFSPRPEIPLSPDLLAAAHRLRTSERGWDRCLSMFVLGYGDPQDYLPILKETVRTDAEGLVRSEVLRFLSRHGDASVLAWLREQKEVIRVVPLDARRGAGAAADVEREHWRLGEVVDQAASELESRLKK